MNPSSVTVPRVLIVAPNEDLHARAVASELALREVATITLDFAEAGKSFHLSIDLRHGQQVFVHPVEGAPFDLNEVQTIWWRRPKRPPVPQDDNVEISRFVEGEWRQFLAGLEVLTKARWINSPAAEQRAGAKAWQLVQARRCGFVIPRTVMTNHPPAVSEFFNEAMPLVYKRMGAAPRPLTSTKRLQESDLDRLSELPLCPAIFQTHIGAELDIRVTIAGTAVHAVEIHSQEGDSPLDWRFDHSVLFAAHELPHLIKARLLKLMDMLGLEFSAVDLRLTSEGEYVFLEVNPSGQFLFCDMLAGTSIAGSVADLLASGPRLY